MTFTKTQGRQWSEWSTAPIVTVNHQRLTNEKHQINIRSNSIFPINDNQYLEKKTFKITYIKKELLTHLFVNIFFFF